MIHTLSYTFNAVPWKYGAESGWHFVSMPKKMAKEIRSNLQWQEEGWGRLKAKAIVGNTEWKTAIWFDTKQETYLLPLKADVRKKEKIEARKKIRVTVLI